MARISVDMSARMPNCPKCDQQLEPSKDIVALLAAARATDVRLECLTLDCSERGRRRTAAEWAAVAEGLDRKPRPTWDQQFTEVAFLVARRGTCDRSQVGCVIAVANRIAATGYNGALAGADHCDDVGHLMSGASCIRTVHAEANAVADAARRGVSVAGGTAYLTRIPCIDCAKLLVSAGIVRVVAAVEYRDPSTVLWVFQAAGVALEWPGGGWVPPVGGKVSEAAGGPSEG